MTHEELISRLETAIDFFESLATSTEKEREGILGGFSNLAICALNDGSPAPLDHDYLRNLFISWEFYSGVEAYPVPAPGSTGFIIAPHEAWRYLPRWKGEYGELRRRLCHHIAEKLEELLEDLT